jgi:hypothetical protein
MIIFDSLKKIEPIGTGYFIESKKLRFLPISHFSQTIELLPGEHQIKFSGKRNSGNGSFSFSVYSNEYDIITNKTSFPNQNTSSIVFNFSIKKRGTYTFKIFRGKESIGTIIFDSIRIISTNELVKPLYNKSSNLIPVKNNLFIKEYLDINKTSLFLIDDPDSDGSHLSSFIDNKKLKKKECKILNMHSNFFDNKKYPKDVDSRIFLSLDDMVEYIDICEPEAVIILSTKKEILNIKNITKINCIIPDEKATQRVFNPEVDMLDKKIVVFNFDGEFV